MGSSVFLFWKCFFASCVGLFLIGKFRKVIHACIVIDSKSP